MALLDLKNFNQFYYYSGYIRSVQKHSDQGRFMSSRAAHNHYRLQAQRGCEPQSPGLAQASPRSPASQAWHTAAHSHAPRCSEEHATQTHLCYHKSRETSLQPRRSLWVHSTARTCRSSPGSRGHQNTGLHSAFELTNDLYNYNQFQHYPTP